MNFDAHICLHVISVVTCMMYLIIVCGITWRVVYYCTEIRGTKIKTIWVHNVWCRACVRTYFELKVLLESPKLTQLKSMMDTPISCSESL